MIQGSILTRYVARRFFVAILLTFLLCSLLVYMIDLVELLRKSGKYGGGASMWAVAYIGLLRLPAYAEYLVAFAVLVGSIGTLLMLSRKSELTVMRAGGMSVWQFLFPGLIVAVLVGTFGMAVFNPMAASARSKSEAVYAKTFGKETNLLRSKSGGSWLRQDGADGQSVISAALASNRGLTLTGVTVFVFDQGGRFVERVDNLRFRQGIDLGDDVSFLAGPGKFDFAIDAQRKRFEQIERCREQFDEILRLSKARQLHKHLVHIFTKIAVAAHVAVIGIQACRARMVVAGA